GTAHIVVGALIALGEPQQTLQRGRKVQPSATRICVGFVHDVSKFVGFSAARGYLVGVAGFEPATPSSRTRRLNAPPLKTRQFSSRSTTFVAFCSRGFCPISVPVTRRLPPPPRAGNRDDGAHSGPAAVRLSSRGSPPPAIDRRRFASPRSRQCGAGREASRR